MIFCDEVTDNWMAMDNNITDAIKVQLEYLKSIRKPQPISVDSLIKKSDQFPHQFPIASCRITAQPPERRMISEKHAASVYPVIHEKVLYLFLNFLELKKNEGTDIEREYYKTMTITEFVDRLFLKRCVSFAGPDDDHVLIDGTEAQTIFEEVGVSEPMDDRLSYDEMKLSALMPVSSYTDFINKGDRKNAGLIEKDKSKIERDGVIIGMIGGRFHRDDVMEYQDIVISESQNTVENGYGVAEISSSEIRRKYKNRQLWNNFYDEKDILWSNRPTDDPRFTTMWEGTLFDNRVMAKRFAISFDTLLLEAEERAKAVNKRGYIHVVGFGLGVWKISHVQSDIFFQAFERRLKHLLPQLKHISFIDFSWFDRVMSGDLQYGSVIKCDEHPDGGIKIFISQRNPSEKLVGEEFKNTMVIATYAWDSNSLPGNEFWWGSLVSSSDPAAACSTQVAELHNAHINPMLAGNNLHVASEKYGILHVADFAMKVLN